MLSPPGYCTGVVFRLYVLRFQFYDCISDICLRIKISVSDHVFVHEYDFSLCLCFLTFPYSVHLMFLSSSFSESAFNYDIVLLFMFQFIDLIFILRICFWFSNMVMFSEVTSFSDI